MVNQIASGTGSQEQGKKSKNLQGASKKLGQEARSHAPSFSEYCFKIDGAEYTCEIQCNECKKRKQNENKAGR